MVRWVDKTLYQSLTKTNIMIEFRVIRIWPLNPRAMDRKTNLNNFCIENENERKRDVNSISNEEENEQMQ